ncbi:MAG: hypothetical protein JSS81_28615 [Acidobacteria bacterium]|nr:hypothetical protein [Acidobacteriota bacterium]
MSVKSVITTFACNGCGRETVVGEEDEMTEFCRTWYSSMTLDLCPECRKTVRGQGRIMIDRRAHAELREMRKG